MSNPPKVKKAQKVKQVVGYKVQRQGLSLPTEIHDLLKTLPTAERNEYFRELRKGGWTLESIAEGLDLTRERIRQICQQPSDPIAYEKVSHLPVPELSASPIVKLVPKKLEPDLLKKMLELKEKAYWVRGKSPKFRKEAEEYTRLIAEAVEDGVSTYMIAKQLGVTHGAIMFRLVRYGYKQTTGTTKVYRRLNHRLTEEETNE